MDFEITVSLNIYDTIVETTKAPTVAEVANALHSSRLCETFFAEAISSLPNQEIAS